MSWTLEIDDECMANWRPIRSTFLFNRKPPPSDWNTGSYRPGILFQPGVNELIEAHRGDHSACQMRHLLLNCYRNGDEKEITKLFITRSHFEELGLWINILPGNRKAPDKRHPVQTNQANYEALLGAKGVRADSRDRYPGGITVWPAPEPECGKGSKEQYYDLKTYTGANTPHHAWYKFSFLMEYAWAEFWTRTNVLRPEIFDHSYRLAAPVKPVYQEGQSCDIEWPSAVFEEFGIPPGGDGREQPPDPVP